MVKLYFLGQGIRPALLQYIIKIPACQGRPQGVLWSSLRACEKKSVNSIFSHMNAVTRKQFNGKSAYDTHSHSVELSNILGIQFIPADKVIQSPELLR